MPIKLVGISEIDVDAIIAYGVIHLENTYEDFVYLSKEEMQQWLLDRNIGYDFKKKKSTIKSLRLEKLKLVYKYSVLLNNYGDISLINPNKISDFDLFNFSFPCFIAGTLILTDKGYKNIEDIKKEDYVLTHTNTYQKVIKTMINKTNHIYKLSTMCSEDLYVTEEHPFYVRERYRIWNNKKRMYDRLFKEPQWVKTKDLSKDYYVGIAINQESKLPNWNGVEINSTWAKKGNKKQFNNIKNYFLNNDFWWIVGRYMGDGWIGNRIDNKGTDIYDLYICCAKNELFEITNVLDNLNLINNDFKYRYYEDKTVYKIRIANVEFAKFLQQFGKYAHGKKLTNYILDLPVELLKQFLEGYMSADGCDTNGIRKCSSVSKKLIYGIGQCVAKTYNRPYSIYKNKLRDKIHKIEGRIILQKESYSLNFKTNRNKQDHSFYEDGYIWCPINDISKEEYAGLVYNIEIENDNSYTANNIIVHNCTDVSVAGKQKGMKDERGNVTRSGQYIYGINIIKAKKPRYIMIENVKNLISKKFINDFYDIINELNNIGYNCYYLKNDKGKPMCLNAKDYGVPQNRERIFVVCVRKNIDKKQYLFPNGFDNGIRLKNLLEDKVDEKYYISQNKTDKLIEQLKNKDSLLLDMCQAKREGKPREYNDFAPTISARDYKEPRLINEKIMGVYNQKDGFKQKDVGCTLDASYYKGLGNNQNRNAILETNNINVVGRLDIKGQDNIRRVYNPKGISPTLSTMQGGHREPKILEESPMPKLVGGIGEINFGKQYRQGNRVYSSKKTAMCLMSQPVGNTGGYSYLYSVDCRIRKLTPKECWRLMDFDDEDIDKCIDIGISNTQLYKMAGNSIVVSVLYYIFKNLFNV